MPYQSRTKTQKRDLDQWGSQSYVRNGAKDRQGRQENRGEARQISLEHISRRLCGKFHCFVYAFSHQHHDQVPGFYRLKVGDLEVTALYDGTGAFDPRWLNGTKATMDGVVTGLNEDPHMQDVVDSGFLVNTGKQLIPVDAGAGTWWGAERLGAWWAASVAQAIRRKKSTSFW